MALQMKKASGGTGLCTRSSVIGFIGEMTSSIVRTK